MRKAQIVIFCLVMIAMFIGGILASPVLKPEVRTDKSRFLQERAKEIKRLFIENGHIVANGSDLGEGYFRLEVATLEKFHLYLHAWAPNMTVLFWNTSSIYGEIPTFSFLAITTSMTWLVIYRVYE